MVEQDTSRFLDDWLKIIHHLDTYLSKISVADYQVLSYILKAYTIHFQAQIISISLWIYKNVS